jgi:long-chain acyl-CoA synthetase
MPEFSTPGLVEVDPATSISTLLAERVARDPEGSLAERRSPFDGGWTAVSARAFADEVIAVARGLVASGVDPGDRVAIMSRTRYEWSVVDFAVWAAGAVGVPVYETSSADQVLWILSDSDVRAVVVETRVHAALVAGVRGDLPHSPTSGSWTTTPSRHSCRRVPVSTTRRSPAAWRWRARPTWPRSSTRRARPDGPRVSS